MWQSHDGSAVAAHEQRPNHESKGQDTVVVDRGLENSRQVYRPTRWQSNLTILSCVSQSPLRLASRELTESVHRQLQRRLPELPGEPDQYYLQAAAW